MATRDVPYFKPFITDDEVNAAVAVIRSGWLCMGPKVIEFEDEFKKYTGNAKHAIAVSSATAALHICLVAHGVGPGDEVITTPYTFAATVNVIEHVGAKPVLADIDPETFNIDPVEIKKKITSKTKAIIPVHFAGQACKLDEILEIAKEKNILVIEDAAHAIGSDYKGVKIGANSKAACFSFYVNKNITTAEGGIVLTNDDALAEQLSMLRLQGMSKDAWKRYSSKNKWKYDVVAPGYKYNLTDLQASIGLAQLKKVDELAAKRADIARQYTKAFKDIPGLIVPKEIEKGNSWHLYPLRTTKVPRDEFIEKLSLANVGTGVHFIPVHLFSYYRNKYGFKEGDFPKAEKCFNEELSLPMYARLSQEDIDYVIESVLKIAKG